MWFMGHVWLAKMFYLTCEPGKSQLKVLFGPWTMYGQKKCSIRLVSQVCLAEKSHLFHGPCMTSKNAFSGLWARYRLPKGSFQFLSRVWNAKKLLVIIWPKDQLKPVKNFTSVMLVSCALKFYQSPSWVWLVKELNLDVLNQLYSSNFI